MTERTAPLVRYTLDGDVAILTLNNAPVNALSNGLRQALHAQLKIVLDDPAVSAIVLCGEGRFFCAGADIREFSKLREQPWTAAIAHQIDVGDKPVVAAIHGAALGGGLELALGAHSRIAGRSARLGLPEVKLGLIPGGGGTQRLPRLVGASIAAMMIATGDFVDAARALDIGLVDQVVDDGSEALAAVDLARSLVRTRTPLRRTRDATALDDVKASRAELNAVRTALVQKIGGALAPRLALESIARAMEAPFDEGMEFELNSFLRCLASPERELLVQEFFAKRQGTRTSEPGDT
ncbi:enoyl-CoA hydratase/isomerase family protein [Ottowia thiooxydans]|uniref:enoyl-CoA hydratase/isomerase family protein n=1 Tax=Ottowia thiooxydans TaxID=219182 RepID=UPI00041EB005|nr:enoyl-CoA hydratase-related protein [Ottowia thiooxydans]